MKYVPVDGFVTFRLENVDPLLPNKKKKLGHIQAKDFKNACLICNISK